MSPSGGHWLNLDEVKRLTQATLIPGVIDEDVKRGNPFTLLPMAQANHTGSKIQWLRSLATATEDVKNFTRGALRTWTESITYTPKESELHSCNLSRLLDKFIPSVYGTFNNYEEIQLNEMMSAMKKKMGDKMVYDDLTYDGESLQMDGLHAMAAESVGLAWDIDMAEAPLSIYKWRTLMDEMKQGVDFWLVPFWLPRRLSAALQEAGLAQLASGTAGNLLQYISSGVDQFGQPQMYFGGIPMVPSDFLVAEQANTGVGTDARAKYSTGTKQYSIFGIKKGTGDLGAQDPGLKLAFGMTEGNGDFFNLEYFDKLETHINTKGMSITAHTTMINGSAYCIGRIFDITDAALVY